MDFGTFYSKRDKPQIILQYRNKTYYQKLVSNNISLALQNDINNNSALSTHSLLSCF